jgi:hypothetical protein
MKAASGVSRLALLVISLFVAFGGCGGGGTSGGGQSSLPEGSYDFMGFVFDAAGNEFRIFDHAVENVYQIRVSPDGEKAIYSVVQPGGQPDLFIASKNSPEITRVTANDYIEFDPAINNSGDYAYALHEGSVASSKVFVNNSQIDLPAGLYKQLAFHNNILVMHYARHYDETDWLVIYNTGSHSVAYVNLGIVPDFIAFRSSTKIVLQGLSHANHKNEILLYDIGTNQFSYLKRSSDADTCYLDDYRYGETIKYTCFAPAQITERLRFLGLRHLRENDPAGSLACSNNYLGRLSWNVSYRLQGLLALDALDVEVDYPVDTMIRNIAGRLVDRVEESADNFGWPTKKYSLSGADKLSLLVDDAMIIYPLLQAANRNLLDNATKTRIIALAEGIYDWHEAEYDAVNRQYHFKKGISYWADGLWLPFNHQHVFGLALIELYEATGDVKYKTRALELATEFRSEWVTLPDGRNIWHYWPGEYYAGWDAADDLSVNTPSRDASVDELYEDTFHGGLSVKFVFGIYDNFAESPFSSADVLSLADTLDGFRYGSIYSRFVSGDTDYQPASRRFLPLYGWQETGDGLLIEHVSYGIPFVYPLFEGDSAMTYYMSR